VKIKGWMLGAGALAGLYFLTRSSATPALTQEEVVVSNNLPSLSPGVILYFKASGDYATITEVKEDPSTYLTMVRLKFVKPGIGSPRIEYEWHKGVDVLMKIARGEADYVS
jgi:hypothetical protein